MVMRDQDDAALVCFEVLFEPVARLDIEMVGRLVEHQEVGPLQQQFGQRDAHPDAAGELGDVAREILLAKAQAEQHRRRAAVGVVKAVALEFAEHIAQFLQRGVVSRPRMIVREDFFELDPAAIMLAHLGQRRERLIEHRTTAHFGRILMQIADAGALRARDAAAVGLNQFGDNPQQRRFAGAVEPDQPDPAVVRHGPARTLENRAPAVMFGDLVERQHFDFLARDGMEPAVAPFKPLMIAVPRVARKPSAPYP